MKIAVVDDNKEVLNSIEELLNNSIFGNNDIYTYQDTYKLEKLLLKENIDLLFIDIKLEDNNGIDFIKNNKKILNHTNIVYITGYDEYIEKIFETEPIYLLKKPITKDKLLKVFNKIFDKQNDKYLLLKTGKEICKIPIKDIVYIESFGRIVEIHLINNVKKPFYNKISNIIDLLPNNFIRTHKSYIVNLNKVKNYNKKEITMDNNTIIPISRLKYSEINNKITNYIKEMNTYE